MNLVKMGVLELDSNTQIETDGGIIFLIGFAIGVVLGAGGVYAGYHIAEYLEE